MHDYIGELLRHLQYEANEKRATRQEITNQLILWAISYGDGQVEVSGKDLVDTYGWLWAKARGDEYTMLLQVQDRTSDMYVMRLSERGIAALKALDKG